MITVLTGSNGFLLKSELDRLVAEFVNEHSDMGLERIDGEEAEYDRIREALQSLPFLASKKLVVLRSPSANKEFIENAESLLAELPEITDVIIVESKLDKRSVYYKFLKKSTDYKEFNELDENGLSRWLIDEAKRLNGSISPGDARYLVQRVGANQQLLGNEIKKLVDYDSKVTHASIELLTDQTPQSTIFQLLDAAFVGNIKQALKIYAEQRANKVEPQQIIALLGWQLHVLAVVKTAGQRSDAEIAKETKLNPYVISKSRNLTRSLTLARLKELIHELVTLDRKLKTISIDADDALQHYLLTLSAN